MNYKALLPLEKDGSAFFYAPKVIVPLKSLYRYLFRAVQRWIDLCSEVFALQFVLYTYRDVFSCACWFFWTSIYEFFHSFIPVWEGKRTEPWSLVCLSIMIANVMIFEKLYWEVFSLLSSGLDDLIKFWIVIWFLASVSFRKFFPHMIENYFLGTTNESCSNLDLPRSHRFATQYFFRTYRFQIVVELKLCVLCSYYHWKNQIYFSQILSNLMIFKIPIPPFVRPGYCGHFDRISVSLGCLFACKFHKN